MNLGQKTDTGFARVELRGATSLNFEFLSSGAIFAIRHGPTLINQFLPGPADEGLFRLLFRWRSGSEQAWNWASLVGPNTWFSTHDTRVAEWRTAPIPGLQCRTELTLDVEKSAWSWRVVVSNDTRAAITFDLFHAQDLGLADEGAVRNNEAYTSQYIDLLPIENTALGWLIFARQNQAMAKGHHPWLAVGCAEGAAEFCTDGTQFYGMDHRLAGIPLAVREEKLASQRKQGEFALAGLQSRRIELAPGAKRQTTFIARFVEDHPAASSEADIASLRELVPTRVDALTATRAVPLAREDKGAFARSSSASLFTTAPWLHGEAPSAADWTEWFPGERRHEERDPKGAVLSFFHGGDTHVVAQGKEASIARPHGHILRSGDGRWFDANHFGLTCYASGIFAAQAYYGHPSFARLLSVVRNPLNVPRASGQRVFVRRDERWQQLGVPSAFAMTPGDARWIYKLDDGVIELRAFCSGDRPFACLEIRMLKGRAREFLISHELVLGTLEFEHAGELDFNPSEHWVACLPSDKTLVGRHEPGVCFAIAAAESREFAAIRGAEGLVDSAQENGDAVSSSRSSATRGGSAAPLEGPYVLFQTRPTMRCALIMLGTSSGRDALPEAVRQARSGFERDATPARPLASAVELRRPGDRAVERVNEILPWFAHNAAIHFSAPHGLEQYGGAAWGVRDVCQGSVEWLLASRQFGVVRRILEVVFAQQYAADGSWPQWFMFPPYRFIQQAHSHGDVCFWPVKALCDYIEASGDIEFLGTSVGYTDPKQFIETGPRETILQHCERVLAQCDSRLITGTSLVNYGDGDWDDTLQPADPELRTRMVSAWTVGLAFHAFRQFAHVCRRAGADATAGRLEKLCQSMRRDFSAQLMPDGVVAGFLIFEKNGTRRSLLHPRDAVTHIRYRLLPMTRSILAELFTLEEAQRHLEIIGHELRYPDGVRLMSEPTPYLGGIERLFKRAETAANVGREIGLQYVHAHLRYAEALAKVGRADELWWAVQAVNPVDLRAVVANAAPRQSNVYFSSSDAEFTDRYEAEKRWTELRTGSVPVHGGWRLYSSGPGLFLHKIRSCLLGLRESFDDVVFDPVLPRALDGLTARVNLCGKTVEVRYAVRDRVHTPKRILVNSVEISCARHDANPYRCGGVLVAARELGGLLNEERNLIEVQL
jgi:CRISPR-associated protein Csx3